MGRLALNRAAIFQIAASSLMNDSCYSASAEVCRPLFLVLSWRPGKGGF